MKLKKLNKMQTEKDLKWNRLKMNLMTHLLIMLMKILFDIFKII